MSELYTILKQNDTEVKLQLSSSDHPIFVAHFPNNPILPGFMIIDIIAKILNDTITHIKQSKFIAQILPDDIIIYKIESKKSIKNITVYKNEKKVSSIKYESK